MPQGLIPGDVIWLDSAGRKQWSIIRSCSTDASAGGCGGAAATARGKVVEEGRTKHTSSWHVQGLSTSLRLPVTVPGQPPRSQDFPIHSELGGKGGDGSKQRLLQRLIRLMPPSRHADKAR